MLAPESEAPSCRHDATASVVMPTAFRRFSTVKRSAMPELWKLPSGMRNVRPKSSPSGLNQTSASFSPLYFKAAHCFEGGSSEKFIQNLPAFLRDHELWVSGSVMQIPVVGKVGVTEQKG